MGDSQNIRVDGLVHRRVLARYQQYTACGVFWFWYMAEPVGIMTDDKTDCLACIATERT